MGMHARQNRPIRPNPPGVVEEPRDHRLPLPETVPNAEVRHSGAPALDVGAGAGADVSALLGVLTSVHSERMGALAYVREYLSGERDIACALVALYGYPALSISRVDGIGGTFTLGCAYRRPPGEWWFVTPCVSGGTEWLARMQEPFKTTQMVLADMRRRTA